MNRRQVLAMLGAGVTAPLVGASLTRGTHQRLPAIFLAHGAPPLVDDPLWTAELRAWGAALPRPKAILMISAHWEERPVTLGATRPVPLVYDFYGFPQKYYEMQYPAPGAPELASRVRELLGAKGETVADDPERGLDHGAYVPLMFLYPEADVPVLQMSMPTLDPAALLELGRALAPLRDEGVLIVGSGFLTHNLREAWGPGRPTPSWAAEFDTWVADALQKRDYDALIDFRTKAPAAARAHPRIEHYVPVVVAAGAGGDDAVSFPVEGFWFGPFTKRSVQIG
jgi:4,5-DOPA dioxygenase extradiol